ncbi:MAG: hypothetical protein QOE97_2328 [Pseudonocardiales bacterium]|jgi:hypothetical protein|nr:hypothetical protein [Pseudonocardiales bacterium]
MKISPKAAVAAAVTVVAACVVTAAAPAGADPRASDGRGGNSGGDRPYTFAVIGDIPYGDAQIANFPNVIAQINADPAVQWVDHLGDIKSGSSVCSDAYFATIKQRFDAFVDPLVYTPGDNEWTDCHRPNNGGYNPLERLSAVRTVFFPHPGTTLGQHPATVTSQATQGLPENVRWERAGVAFTAVNIPGSNNSLAPWTGQTAPTPDQTAEVLARTSADIQLIHDTFATAKAHHDKAVTLLTQADMFDPTVANPQFADYFGFQAIVAAIARESAAFRGPVYLFNGDSHVYNDDKPLAGGSSWLSFYGITTPAQNLTRVTVDGSTGVNDYLRVTVQDHGSEVLTWERVPFAS